MAHDIPTISTDELLERIAPVSLSGWRHEPTARGTREARRAAERRPLFKRVPDRHLGGLEVGAPARSLAP
jgi:hypothetical protein